MDARLAAIAGVICFAVAGCQNPPAPTVEQAQPGFAATRQAALSADVDEQCADQMHHLEGLLLMYAAAHQELPPSLDKLAPLNQGKPVAARCPAGTDYVYVPKGLVAQGDLRELILYDAAPVHHGKRQAIMLTPARNGEAPFLDVIMITDEILKAFHAPADAKR